MKLSNTLALSVTTSFVLFGSLSGGASAATIINFDDGTGGGIDVGSFYSSQGVTFSNGEWATLSGFTPHPDSSGLMLIGDAANFQPKAGSPIVFTFSSPMAIVSMIANNVNANGARMDLYDSEIGGSLVGSDQVVGPSGSLNSNFTLSASGSGIRRVELYQPFNTESEGVLFDNLQFDSVPEPSSAFLVGLGALGFISLRKRTA